MSQQATPNRQAPRVTPNRDQDYGEFGNIVYDTVRAQVEEAVFMRVSPQVIVDATLHRPNNHNRTRDPNVQAARQEAVEDVFRSHGLTLPPVSQQARNR